MTQKQMRQRIDDLEDALFSIRARIDIILRAVFDEDEFLIRSQSGGLHPMYAEDVFKMLKHHFEPEA